MYKSSPEFRQVIDTHHRRRKTHSFVSALLGVGILSIGGCLVDMSISSIPAVPPATVPFRPTNISTETPSASESKANSFGPKAALDRNLYLGSELLTDLRDIYDRDGLIATFFECKQDNQVLRERVENPVKQRSAPSLRIGKVLRELSAGESVESPFEVTIKSVVEEREPAIKKWSAQLSGENLSFVAREQSYRDTILKQYLVDNYEPGWSFKPYCRLIPINYIGTLQSKPAQAK